MDGKTEKAFDLDMLNAGYLAERAGVRMDEVGLDRLDLWCEDLHRVMAPDPSDSVQMAKRTSALWHELGVIWPADGDPGIQDVQADMLKAVMADKGFGIGGRDFEDGFDKAMENAADPDGYRNIYKLVAGGIRGDGVTRDGYGRKLHENGRPEKMRYYTPGRYAGEMKRDNARIRQELYGEDLPAPSAVERVPAQEPVQEAAPRKKPGALSRLMSMLGRDDGATCPDHGSPEL